MKKYIYCICLLLLFCAACQHARIENKNTEPKQPEKEQEIEIPGEAFVVTKGAQNIKLGLVDVIAIPEDQIAAYLENKKREADTRRTEFESASIRAESEYFKAQSDFD